MNFIVLFLFMLGSALAGSYVSCHLTDDGIYNNSPNAIADLKFEALVDNFSIGSAKDFSIKIEGEELRFLRTRIEVSKYTKMTFTTRKIDSNRAAIIHLDRTPKKALKTKAFNGNVIISPSVSNEGVVNELEKTLTYNFYCTF